MRLETVIGFETGFEVATMECALALCGCDANTSEV
jgi:hypothetical protein